MTYPWKAPSPAVADGLVSACAAPTARCTGRPPAQDRVDALAVHGITAEGPVRKRFTQSS